MACAVDIPFVALRWFMRRWARRHTYRRSRNLTRACGSAIQCRPVAKRCRIVRISGEGKRVVSEARWGLDSFVGSREKPKSAPINARAETVRTSGMFRQAMDAPAMPWFRPTVSMNEGGPNRRSSRTLFTNPTMAFFAFRGFVGALEPIPTPSRWIRSRLSRRRRMR